MLGRYLRNFAILCAAVGVVLISQTDAYCQEPPGDGAGVGGIEINANGVLSARSFAGNPALLNRQRLAAARASLNTDLQKPNAFRKVSLTRLEREVKKLIDAGESVPADMQYLAGLTKITHVFFYPDTKDIVIAGPAEGYFVNADNHVVGTNTGRATLQLQDLIVALRCFGPDGNTTKMISCSIDPTQEGLTRFRDTYTQIQRSGNFRPGLEAEVIRLYREALGMQQISINGVPAKTHFARVLVEADYDMKLIGIGLKGAPVKGVISFIEKATPSSVARSSLQRWFFQPDYDCVHVNEDETAMELVGNGVKLVGADESVGKNGKRQRTSGVNRASLAYCNSFTRLYPQMAKTTALWGELRNVIDLSVVAAFIQKMDLYGQADWKMATFGDESIVPVEVLDAPLQVAPVANAVWKGNYFMSPIAGGVNIQPRVALNSDRMKKDDAGSIDKVKNEIKLDNLADNQWWWD